MCSFFLNLSDDLVLIGMTIEGLCRVLGATVGFGGALGLPLGRPGLAESWQKHGVFSGHVFCQVSARSWGALGGPRVLPVSLGWSHGWLRGSLVAPWGVPGGSWGALWGGRGALVVARGGF